MAFTNFKMSQNDQHLARYFFDYVIRDFIYGKGPQVIPHMRLLCGEG